MRMTKPVVLLFVLISAVAACVQADSEPTPDLAATVRDAVKQALPTPVSDPDIVATVRAVVHESLPEPVLIPNAEATARAVVRASLPEPVLIPDAEATAHAVVRMSLPELVVIPDVEATSQSVVKELVTSSLNIPEAEGPELRATLQNMVAIRRYEDTGVSISIDEVMIQATKFRDHSDIPSQFRLQYDDFIGLWLNNHALESWIEHNASPTSVSGICCYYLDIQERALYRAVILDLPKLTHLINDAEGLGIDSRYLAEALDRIQDGYTIVYESFTW